MKYTLFSANIGDGKSHGKNVLTKNMVPRLFRSLEFANGSRMSDEKLAILEFKYLQNLKWQKQAVKSTGIKKCFYFNQISNKNPQFTFKKFGFSTFTMSSLHL